MSETTDAPVSDVVEADTGTDVEQTTEGSDGGAPEIKTAAELAEEMFELTVDGQVEKVTKAELLKRASHSSAAAKRLQEATAEKKAALRLAELLKSDPIKAAKELNKEFNEREFLTKRLSELMEEDMLTPEEKSQRADLAELRALREEAKLRKAEQEQAELDKLTQSRLGELDVEIGDAIKAVGLPRTAASVKRLASAMYVAEEAGLNVSARQLAEQVKHDMQQEILELLKVADDDAFEALLGSDLLTKAQRASLKKIKQPGQRVDPSIKAKTGEEKVVTRKSKAETMAELGYKDLLF